MTHLTTPNEDYLERIYELLNEKGYARVVDIAERLDVKPASVTMMVKKLEISGYILRERYRGFTLTPKGRSVGLRIQKRHKILSEFLHLLHLPDRVIEHDIEGLEHYLSDQTLAQLETLVKKLKKQPSR
ncbi:MAG TPA: transcriptional regulator MntR [Patescibacteria group bacterium]|nr:transcriptional regulator MntR [Patescibacteria group bacterium]